MLCLTQCRLLYVTYIWIVFLFIDDDTHWNQQHLHILPGGNILIRTCYYDWEITGFIFRQPTNPPLYSLELTYCPLRQHFLPIVMPHILLRVPLVHYIHLIILEALFARLLFPLAIKNGYICRSESLKVLCGIWNEYICRSGSLKVLCGI